MTSKIQEEDINTLSFRRNLPRHCKSIYKHNKTSCDLSKKENSLTENQTQNIDFQYPEHIVSYCKLLNTLFIELQGDKNSPKLVFHKYNEHVTAGFIRYVLNREANLPASALQILLHFFWKSKQIHYAWEVIKNIFDYPLSLINSQSSSYLMMNVEQFDYLFGGIIGCLHISFLLTYSMLSLPVPDIYESMVKENIKYFKRTNQLNLNHAFEHIHFEVIKDFNDVERSFFLAAFDKEKNCLVIDVLFSGLCEWHVWFNTILLAFVRDTQYGTSCHYGIGYMYDNLKLKLDKALRIAYQRTWKIVSLSDHTKRTFDIRVKVSGHRVGGALATLFGYELGHQFDSNIKLCQLLGLNLSTQLECLSAKQVLVFTSGCPAIFNPFKDIVASQDTTIVNLFHHNDLIVKGTNLLFSSIGHNSPFGPITSWYDFVGPYDYLSHFELLRKIRNGHHNFIFLKKLQECTPWNQSRSHMRYVLLILFYGIVFALLYFIYLFTTM